MKIKPFAVQTMLAISLLAGGSTLALAAGGEQCGEGDKTCLPRLMEKLELGPAQRKQIRHIFTQQRGELQEQHRALRDVRRKLYNAASRDDYAAVQVKQLIKKQS
ncbi:MAG: Spy/CpxP family protein refolding chaperone, partial [Pseudomonadota bacterium]